MYGASSKTRTLNDGLTQGSVLALLLFNLYISDMHETIYRKIGYADENAQEAQQKDPVFIENVLNTDLIKLEKYCKLMYRTQTHKARLGACLGVVKDPSK